MARGIGTADDDTFLVPVHAGPNVGRTVTQRQPAATAVGIVRLRSVQQQVVVDRDLPRLQLDVDRLTELLGIVDRLVEDVLAVIFSQSIREMAEVMRPRDEPHAGVFTIGVVDRQPDGGRLRGGQGPIAGILMPGDAFAVVRHFAEEVRSPRDHIFAQQVADTVHDPPIGQQVVHAAIFQMGRADRIACSARGQNPGQEIVKIAAILQAFGLAKDADPFEVSVAIVVFDLRVGESARKLVIDGMKPQVTIHLSDVIVTRESS